MIFRQLNAGGDRNFSYIIADEQSKEAAVIDPGLPLSEVTRFLTEKGLKLKYIINTHDHYDHMGGNKVLADTTGAKIAMHESAYSTHDIDLKDGDVLNLGTFPLRIIHTPGHTRDSICIYAGNELVTGDTLFVGKVGGTGYGQDARNEYDSLHDKLMTLPSETGIWPGHDYGVRPSSTIGDELGENPFILCENFETFVELKRNWLEYNRKHGIK